MGNAFSNFTGKSARTFEQQAEAGGLIPPGVYYAVLEQYESDFTQNGNERHKLKFKIAAGLYSGRTVGGAVIDSEKTAHVIPLVAHRLGLLTVDARGDYQPVAGKESFHDAIGIKVWIDVKHKEFKDAEGIKKIFAELEFIPICKPTDVRVAAESKKLGIQLPITVTNQQAAKPQTSTSVEDDI